ncbi:8-amino-7-oxononanoate synthase [candidate division TA06 bacterium B3_TA06]|uniref:8-amino-7-oxononanoate synthase n=1 Tax=candidate division TA06 bacterium B3_TA06 TaxID=2012487 RepID=A0A532V2I7_UNCT6|nr:MAG: 8-amino-7-oxononanoate synthase [candidate division TA06 bacterium B3_TA06]
MIMLGSNNYLGLTADPRVKEAAIRATEKYGTGCTGSRFLNGTLDIHIELEEKLAKFVHKEDCICFSTGYQTNLGSISALVQKGDYVVTDKLDHASIIDGAFLSRGAMKRFVHNDMDSLQQVLASLPADAGKLVVVDGLFSMQGDIAPLPELVPLCKRYGARIMVDEAHSAGVMGPTGAGVTEHFSLSEEVDLVMGTFSKSFASLGGFIAGERKVITFIRHNARSLIFSASMTPASVASALAALEIIIAEPQRREQLWRNTRMMLDGLPKLGFDIGTSESPVIPLHIGDDMKTLFFWKELHHAGVFVNPVLPPGVPPARCLIRTSCMATHTEKELHRALEIFQKVGVETGVL